MQLFFGTYTGTGSGTQSITGVGFTPVFVAIIRAASAASSFWTSSSITSANTVTFTGATAEATGYINSLDSNGFTVGTTAGGVNATDVVYYYLCMSADVNNIDVGSYSGVTGTGNLTVNLNYSWTPSVVLVKSATSAGPTWICIANGFPATNSRSMAYSKVATNGITGEGAGTFTVDKSNAAVSSDGVTYYYVAFKDCEAITTGYWDGDGNDDRSINIGYPLDGIWTANAGSVWNSYCIWKSDDSGDSTDTSSNFSAATAGANFIQKLIPASNQIEVGSNVSVNRASYPVGYIGFMRYLGVKPTGITSLENFGTVNIIKKVTVAVGGVESLESVGLPTVETVLAENIIEAAGIDTAESIGEVTILTYKIVTVDGIVSTEGFSTPALQKYKDVAVDGIDSLESFLTPEIICGLVSIATTGIDSSETFATPIVLVGLVILPNGILSEEEFGTVNLIFDQTVLPEGLPGEEDFSTPTFILKIVFSATSIDSLESFGTIHLIYPQTISPNGIASAEVFAAVDQNSTSNKAFAFHMPDGFCDASPTLRHGNYYTGMALANRVTAAKFLLTGTGAQDITEIGVWVKSDGGASTNFKLAIFTHDDANDRPESLVANSVSDSINVASETVYEKKSFTYVTLPTNLLSGSYYWLAVINDDGKLHVDYGPHSVTRVAYTASSYAFEEGSVWHGASTTGGCIGIYAVRTNGDAIISITGIDSEENFGTPISQMENGFVEISPTLRHGNVMTSITNGYVFTAKFTCPGTGGQEISEIGIWVTSALANRTLELAIYTDDGTYPEALVTNSTTGAINFGISSTPTKISFSYNTRPILTAGVSYWIAVHATSGFSIDFHSTESNTTRQRYSASGWPEGDTWHSGGAIEKRDIGIYAVYTEAIQTVEVNGINTAEEFGSISLIKTIILSLGGIDSDEEVNTPNMGGVIFANITGILTGEDFGTPTLFGRITVTVDGIATGESFGTTSVTGHYIISIGSIDSQESFSTPNLIKTVTITFVGIGSLEEFGELNITGTIAVETEGIQSLEQFGTPNLIKTVGVSVNGISSLEDFGTPTFIKTITISVDGISSLEDFGTPVLSKTITVAIDGISSLEDFGTIELIKTVTIAFVGIDSLEEFGGLGITGVVVVTMDGIDSQENFGSVGVAGFTTVPVDGIDSLEQFGSIDLIKTIIISLGGIDSGEEIGFPSTGGIIYAFVDGITSGEAFGTATIATFITVTVDGITSGEAFGSVTVFGHYVISVGSISSQESFGSIVLIKTVTIAFVGIDSLEEFGTLGISGIIVVPTDGITSGESFGSVVLIKTVIIVFVGIDSLEEFGTLGITGLVVVPTDGITSGESFGTPGLIKTITVTVDGIDSLESFGTPVLVKTITISVDGIGSQEAFVTPNVGGTLFIFPDGITSEESFGAVDFIKTVTISVTGIGSAESIGTLQTTTLTVVSVTGISSAESFGFGEQDYTRGEYASLPADDTNLTTEYSEGDYDYVAIDDDSRVAMDGSDSNYIIHMFKDTFGELNTFEFTCIAQSSVAPSTASVFLQIYNRISDEWDTLDETTGSEEADVDFTLTATVNDLTNYKDGNGVVSCRVYQEPTGISEGISGISSTESFGTVDVIEDTVTKSITGISSAESFGTAQVLTDMGKGWFNGLPIVGMNSEVWYNGLPY